MGRRGDGWGNRKMGGAVVYMYVHTTNIHVQMYMYIIMIVIYLSFSCRIRRVIQQNAFTTWNQTTIRQVGNYIIPSITEYLNRRSLACRALFTHDASKDSDRPGEGLSFNHGDILHIVNGSDEEWWQASLVDPDAVDGPAALIPSKKRCIHTVHVYIYLSTVSVEIFMQLRRRPSL